jgi:hypothetical protein
MSSLPSEGELISKQDRKGVIGSIPTPLALTALAVLVAEALFTLVILRNYVREEQHIWVILCIATLLLAFVLLAWMYAKREQITLNFTVRVNNRAEKYANPAVGALVTLFKNDKPIGKPKKTSSQGHVPFTVDLSGNDDVMVKVEVGGKSQDLYLVTAGFQQGFNVEFVTEP